MKHLLCEHTLTFRGPTLSGGFVQAEVPIYNTSAYDLYGFRGEWPGLEQFDRGDFTGFQDVSGLIEGGGSLPSRHLTSLHGVGCSVKLLGAGSGGDSEGNRLAVCWCKEQEKRVSEDWDGEIRTRTPLCSRRNLQSPLACDCCHCPSIYTCDSVKCFCAICLPVFCLCVRAARLKPPPT